MEVIWIERRNGTTTVTAVDYESGKRQRLSRHVVGKEPQRQLSKSNGLVGTAATLRAQQKLDAQLGVPINYVETHRKVNKFGNTVCAWRAEFNDRAHKNQWLRAHKRVDLDASYGDPTPGDFAGRYPQESD